MRVWPSGKASAFQADIHGFESRHPLFLSRLEETPPVRGPVAQRSERAAHNRQVAGSNPAGPTFLDDIRYLSPLNLLLNGTVLVMGLYSVGL
jgi:hypothetical protein